MFFWFVMVAVKQIWVCNVRFEVVYMFQEKGKEANVLSFAMRMRKDRSE
jgi:hypothetical protein